MIFSDILFGSLYGPSNCHTIRKQSKNKVLEELLFGLKFSHLKRACHLVAAFLFFVYFIVYPLLSATHLPPSICLRLPFHPLCIFCSLAPSAFSCLPARSSVGVNLNSSVAVSCVDLHQLKSGPKDLMRCIIRKALSPDNKL